MARDRSHLLEEVNTIAAEILSVEEEAKGLRDRLDSLDHRRAELCWSLKLVRREMEAPNG